SGADPSAYVDASVGESTNGQLCGLTPGDGPHVVDHGYRARWRIERDGRTTAGLRRDHDRRQVLVHRQRGHARGVTGLQVPREPAVRDALGLERGRIGDQVAVHTLDD